jgi:RimJ/RimL family protein N-acetyltransferase
MISFKVLNGENNGEVINSFAEALSGEGLQTLAEIAQGFNTGIEDSEFALSVYSGCALVRVFDMGRYCFLFPYEIEADSDVSASISAIAEYAMREEIPLIFSDVPFDCLSYFRGFRHMDIDAEDAEAESYRVRIKNECELISSVPSVARGRVELNEISEDDIADYARLCKEQNVNKYWGYNYSEDVSNPSDRYFYENALREFSSGVSVSMAIRFEGKFIGEGVIYAFDGRGSAEFAIRLLPEWQGKGLGTESSLAISDVGRKIGLTRLSSRVMNANGASLAMLKKISDCFTKEESESVFYIDLS